MTALPTIFPRVPLKQMDPSMLVFELSREADRLGMDSDLITSAATMASYLHRDQTRSVRGDMPVVPYIEHPLRVALRLVRWGVRDEEIIAAALLHDVAEDCADELKLRFGRPSENAIATLMRLYGGHVAQTVMSVTNPTDGTSYQDHMADLAHNSSLAALLVKASDMKDNAGSIKHQMGYGEDEHMLRRARKYENAIEQIINGLGRPTRNSIDGLAAAIHELRSVQRDLADLLEDDGITHSVGSDIEPDDISRSNSDEPEL